jgi:DNA-binding response OmpR family regulator
MRILIVTSDPTLQHQMHAALSRHNFMVDDATNGEEVWELLHAFFFDLVVLDVVLDGALSKRDGFALCRRLRDAGNPVLILLMVDALDVEVCAQGLDCGADACIEKPIQEPRLFAQIRALARRDCRPASLALTWGPLLLDPVAQQITCHGQVVPVSRKEYQILELLLEHPRTMFSPSKIGDRLWTLDEQLPTHATIKSHIRSIRRKLAQAGGAKDLIQTRYGHGYCLNPVYAPEHPAGQPERLIPEGMMDSITTRLWQEAMLANARLQQQIEQHERMEAQLRRSEMMLRTAQRVAQIGCWEFDFQTRTSFWTEELYHIHGLDPRCPAPQADEVLQLIHPEDRQLHQEAIYAPASRGEAFEVNLRIIRVNDGEVRYINARGGPGFDGSGRIVKMTGTTFDVTRWVMDGEVPYG